MKRLILNMMALLLSLSLYAQTRQFMGAYNSDNYAQSGLGLTSKKGTFCAVTFIPSQYLGAYDGGKVVGMRFAVCEAANTSKCFILDYDDKTDKVDTLAVAKVSNSKAGWNTVTFDKPFTLELSKIKNIMMGYDYKQTTSNYPISMVNEGVQCYSYLYGNLGQGTGFYDYGLSSYGNLSVQAIVEKDFDKNSVIAMDFEDIYVEMGKKTEIPLSLLNSGLEAVTSLDYVITVDGKASEEKHLNLPVIAQGMGSVFNVNIPIDAASQPCTQAVEITITKVNGTANASQSAKAQGNLITAKTLFTHRVAVEEYTGTGCGWCPRGMQGMENLRESFGNAFIGIAIHQYTNSSSDAMYLSGNNYQSLSFSGAPSCMIERGDEIDPYYGSEEDIRDDFRKAMNQITPVGVEVSGMWSNDRKTVKAFATVESMTGGKIYDMEYVLVADGLSGTTSTWKQSNYYAMITDPNNSNYQGATSTLPLDLQKYGYGRTYGQSKFYPVFNDVALCSSFVGGKNTAQSVSLPSAYTPVSNECTLTLPTSTILLNAINYEKVYIIALVIDKVTGKIVNAAKNTLGDETAITNVNENEIVNENVYNLSGQRVNKGYKGLVIKNGRKYIIK